MLDLSLKVTKEPFVGLAANYKREDADWSLDIGLNSIQLMELAAQVNTFFNLLDMKNPPYLLALKKVDEWVNCILNARQSVNGAITFHTSGTTGNAKRITHPITFLEREIAFLATLFKDASHIIPSIPSSSIYGFLLTVGLPEKLNIPVLYPSEIEYQHLPTRSLLVATPFHWQLLLQSDPSKSLNCYGVSSAGTLYESSFSEIIGAEVQLTELYGSTETGGIGYRHDGREPFALFPYWEFTHTQGDEELADLDTNTRYSLMDTIEIQGDVNFRVLGRKDNQIKIAGKLTDLDHIQTIIEQIKHIKSCRMSAKAINNEAIIQAEIFLIKESETIRQEIKSQLRNLLQAHEIPGIIHFSTFRQI